MEWFACFLIKCDGGLSLVGDAYSPHVQIVALLNLCEAFYYIVVDLLWVMLHPAGLRGNLTVFSSCYIKYLQVLVDYKNTGGGRTLVNGKDTRL